MMKSTVPIHGSAEAEITSYMAEPAMTISEHQSQVKFMAKQVTTLFSLLSDIIMNLQTSLLMAVTEMILI